MSKEQTPTPQDQQAEALPLSEWHEDMGYVVWWKFPVDEPAWIGSPFCSDWPGYHTHFTPHPNVPGHHAPQAEAAPSRDEALRAALIKDLSDAARWRRLPGNERHSATADLLDRAVAALEDRT